MLPRQTLILAGETRLLLSRVWVEGRHAGTSSCRQANVLVSDLECSTFIIRQIYSLCLINRPQLEAKTHTFVQDSSVYNSGNTIQSKSFIIVTDL